MTNQPPTTSEIPDAPARIDGDARTAPGAGEPTSDTSDGAQEAAQLGARYDPEADALYVRIQAGEVTRTKDLAEGVMVDLDAAGTVLGVEVLNPTRRTGSGREQPCCDATRTHERRRMVRVLRAADVEEAVELIADVFKAEGIPASNGHLVVRVVHLLADRIEELADDPGALDFCTDCPRCGSIDGDEPADPNGDCVCNHPCGAPTCGGFHRYRSTYCLHGKCENCRLFCKICRARCRCPLPQCAHADWSARMDREATAWPPSTPETPENP